MTSLRTLPVRVPPLRGEAIDSWLEALAHRTHTAWADLLSAVGLETPHGIRTSGWIVHTLPDEAAALSRATGITPTALDEMTLSRYADTALRIDPASRTVSRAFPWSRASRSRYCPDCLADTGGRWQLAWRLGWSFACLEHRCLLADACPVCRTVQRHRRLSMGEAIPTPGRCANSAADATGRAPARCDADLTITPVARFDDDHPVLAAQRTVYGVIDTGAARFGASCEHPYPSANALADIRAVAGRILAYATPDNLADVVSPDLLTAYRAVSALPAAPLGPPRTEDKPGLAAPAQAATAAVGVTAALTILGAPDVHAAGDAMRWLVTGARDRGLSVSATNIGWGRRTTPVLTAAQLAALGPMLNPSDQLRYRIAASLPRRPTTGSASADRVIHAVPTMLWPAWSLRFAICGCHQRQLRLALSVALLLVGTRKRLDEAADLLDSPRSEEHTSEL